LAAGTKGLMHCSWTVLAIASRMSQDRTTDQPSNPDALLTQRAGAGAAAGRGLWCRPGSHRSAAGHFGRRPRQPLPGRDGPVVVRVLQRHSKAVRGERRCLPRRLGSPHSLGRAAQASPDSLCYSLVHVALGGPRSSLRSRLGHRLRCVPRWRRRRLDLYSRYLRCLHVAGLSRVVPQLPYGRRRRREAWGLGPFELTADASGLNMVSARGTLSCPWKDVRGLVSADEYLLIQLDEEQYFLVPADVFAAPSEFIDFRDALAQWCIPPGGAEDSPDRGTP
jgi:hypothetical protein